MEISEIFFIPAVFILGICFGAVILWLIRPVWQGFRLSLRAGRARRRAGLSSDHPMKLEV